MKFFVLDSEGDHITDLETDNIEAAKVVVENVIKKRTARGLSRLHRQVKLVQVVGELTITETTPPLSFDWDKPVVNNDQEEDEPEDKD